MGFAGLTRQDARVSTANLDIQSGLRDHDPYLIQIATGQECREAAEPGRITQR